MPLRPRSAAPIIGPMRRVVIVVSAGVQTLDVTGPAEVFRAASLLRPPGYDVVVAAPEDGPLRTSTVSLVPDARLDQVTGAIDTLVVAGGIGARRLEEDPGVDDWIADVAVSAGRG